MKKKEYKKVYPLHSEKALDDLHELMIIKHNFKDYEIKDVYLYRDNDIQVGGAKILKIIGEKVEETEKINIKMFQDWIEIKENFGYIKTGIGNTEVPIQKEDVLKLLKEFVGGLN